MQFHQRPYSYLFTDINEATELLLKVDRSSLVRQLELTDQRDPDSFRVICEFLRAADNRTAPICHQRQYDETKRV